MSLNRRQLLTLGGAACSPLPSLGQATDAAAAPDAAALSTLLQQRLRQLGVGAGVALAAARVDEQGITRASAAAAGQPAPASSARFEYGSVTKTFIALLLADLAVRRELALDEPVESALPSDLRLRDSAGVPLTWADLATHRSGLPRLPDNFRPANPTDPYADYGEGELFAFIDGWRASRPRDSQWEYSNLGFGLLGHALALRSERPLARLLGERVLRPLGLDERVQLPSPSTPVPDLLPGHHAEGRPVPAWRFDALAGAGALVGTLDGLARYAQAACGRIDSPLAPAFQLAQTPRADGGGPGMRMGLGWMLVRGQGGAHLATHDGATAGFASSVWLDLARRNAAVALINSAHGLTDLASHLMDPRRPLRDLEAERRATQAQAAPVAAEQLAPLAGRYQLNPQFAVEVRARSDRLFAQATGQGEFELFASTDGGGRRFFARVTALEMVFEGSDGPPAAMVLRQGGQTLRFVRQP